MKPKRKEAYGILNDHRIQLRNKMKDRLVETAGLDFDKIHWYSNRIEKAQAFDLKDLFGSFHEKHPLFQKLMKELLSHNKMIEKKISPTIHHEYILRQLKRMLKELVSCSDKKSIDNDLNRIMAWYKKATLGERSQPNSRKPSFQLENDSSVNKRDQSSSPLKNPEKKLAEMSFM